MLADVTHPNLVGLYELVVEHDEWFYTMELIEGVDFLSAVRGRELDVPRLRQVLGQVAEGVLTIDRAGKLHRDHQAVERAGHAGHTRGPPRFRNRRAPREDAAGGSH